MTSVYPLFTEEVQLASVLDQPRDRTHRKTDGTSGDHHHLSRIRRVGLAATRFRGNTHQCEPRSVRKLNTVLTDTAPLSVTLSITN